MLRGNNPPEIEYAYIGMLDYIIELINKNYDFPILIDGYPGSGKSSFALNLGIDLDPDIIKNLDKHIFYSFDDFNRVIWDMPPSVLILDESVFGALGRRAMSKENTLMVSVMAICRDLNHIPIFIIPERRELDKSPRDYRVKLWIKTKSFLYHGHIYRGSSKIQTPIKSDFQPVPFWLLEYYLNFPDMPDHIKTQYLQLKREKSKRQALKDVSPDPLKDRNEYIYRLSTITHQNGKRKVNNKELADTFKITDRQIRNIIKEMEAS